jgi:hypothetical protein
MQAALHREKQICLIHPVNPLNTKLNPICHLLALLGAHPILHISRIRVKANHLNTITLFISPPPPHTHTHTHTHTHIFTESLLMGPTTF